MIFIINLFIGKSKNKLKTTICICTFRRNELLKNLVNDLFSQSVKPNLILIVNGDKDNTELEKVLNEKKNENKDIKVINSNHANLPYQRFLGWKVAQAYQYEILIFMDDDLRLQNRYVLENFLSEFLKQENISGATAKIFSIINDKLEINKFWGNKNKIISQLGLSSKIKPGGITSYGNRVLPEFHKNNFAYVEWLQGRIMALKKNSLDESDFSPDLFSMYEKKLGKAEDTYLSRQVLKTGKLIMINIEGFSHADDIEPAAYPTKPYHFGKAVAYSRRFLNDHYRINKPPRLKDRLDLLQTYAGNVFLNALSVINKRDKASVNYFIGYLYGSFLGIFKRPSTKNLTPHINWWQDAEDALKNQIIIE